MTNNGSGKKKLGVGAKIAIIFTIIIFLILVLVIILLVVGVIKIANAATCDEDGLCPGNFICNDNNLCVPPPVS